MKILDRNATGADSVQRRRLMVGTCWIPEGNGMKILDRNATGAGSVQRRRLTVGTCWLPEGSRIKIQDGNAAGQRAVKAHVAQVIEAEAVERR